MVQLAKPFHGVYSAHASRSRCGSDETTHQNIHLRLPFWTEIHIDLPVCGSPCRSPKPLSNIWIDTRLSSAAESFSRIEDWFETQRARASKRFGAFPTFTRAASLRLRTLMMEQSSLPLLLTQQYRPSGENVIQFGHLLV